MTQSKSKLHVPVLAALASTMALSSPAMAALGDGYQIGDGRLRLGVELGGRYDSMAAPTPTGPAADGIGLIRGNVLFEQPGARFSFKLVGAADWNQFMGLNSGTGLALSFFGANVNAAAGYKFNANAGLDLSNLLSRSDRNGNPQFTNGVVGLIDTTRLRGWARPGGGAIEMGVGYDLGVETFMAQNALGPKTATACPENDPNCTPAAASAFNALTNRFAADAKWKLFPKTGLAFDISYGFKNYFSDEAVRAGAVNANPLRATLGFSSALTDRLNVALRGGFGQIFYTDGRAPRQNGIGQVEVGYRVTEQLSARLGYTRADEPIAGPALFFSNNRLFADVRGELNKMVLSGLVSADNITYGGNLSTRADGNLTANASLSVFLTDWLYAVARAGVVNRSVTVGDVPQDGKTVTVDGQAKVIPNLGFTRVEGGVSVAATF